MFLIDNVTKISLIFEDYYILHLKIDLWIPLLNWFLSSSIFRIFSHQLLCVFLYQFLFSLLLQILKWRYHHWFSCSCSLRVKPLRKLSWFIEIEDHLPHSGWKGLLQVIYYNMDAAVWVAHVVHASIIDWH